MGWISIEDKYPPEGLYCLIEASGMGIDEHGVTVYADHMFMLGCWLIPVGETEGEWCVQTRSDFYQLTVHAWMPLPKHFAPQETFTQEPDLMEHAFFEDQDPEWLYKGDAVYEQMSIEDFLREAQK